MSAPMRAEPPYEMNRQRLSRHGRDAQDAHDVDEKLHADHRRAAVADHLSLHGGRLRGDLEAGIDESHNHGEEDERAHEAQLLADDRENVVVVRLGR